MSESLGSFCLISIVVGPLEKNYIKLPLPQGSCWPPLPSLPICPWWSSWSDPFLLRTMTGLFIIRPQSPSLWDSDIFPGPPFLAFQMFSPPALARWCQVAGKKWIVIRRQSQSPLTPEIHRIQTNQVEEEDREGQEDQKTKAYKEGTLNHKFHET